MRVKNLQNKISQRKTVAVINSNMETITVSGQLYDYSGATITLAPEAYASGELTANMRYNAGKNIADKRGMVKDYQTEKLSSLAEVAFYVSVPTDYPYSHVVNEGKDKFDAVCNGWKVDVKQSIYPNLMVNCDQLAPNKVYAAVQTLPRGRFKLVGWLKGSEVASKGERWNANGRGEAYLVKRDKLKPFSKFLRPLSK